MQIMQVMIPVIMPSSGDSESTMKSCIAVLISLLIVSILLMISGFIYSTIKGENCKYNDAVEIGKILFIAILVVLLGASMVSMIYNILP